MDSLPKKGSTMLDRRTLLAGAGAAAVASICAPLSPAAATPAQAEALAIIASGVREFLAHVGQDEYAQKFFYMAPWIKQYRDWSRSDDIEGKILGRLHQAYLTLETIGVGTKEKPLMHEGHMNIQAQFILTEHVPHIPSLHGNHALFTALAQFAPATMA